MSIRKNVYIRRHMHGWRTSKRVCMFVHDVRSKVCPYLGLFKPASLCARVHFSSFSLSILFPLTLNTLVAPQERLKPPKMMKGLRGVVRVYSFSSMCCCYCLANKYCVSFQEPDPNRQTSQNLDPDNNSLQLLQRRLQQQHQRIMLILCNDQ